MSDSLQWLLDFNSIELPTKSTDSRSANLENAESNSIIMVCKYYKMIYIFIDFFAFIMVVINAAFIATNFYAARGRGKFYRARTTI